MAAAKPHPGLELLNEGLNWDGHFRCHECDNIIGCGKAPVGSYGSSLWHNEQIMHELPDTNEKSRLLILFQDPPSRPVPMSPPSNDPALLASASGEHRYF